MKTYYCIYLLLVLFVVSCNPIETPGHQKRFENKTFIHLFFESEEECMENQHPDFFENCHQQLNFLEDGVVEIMLTDVIWRGEYRVDGKTLILSFPPNPEMSEEQITFEILSASKLKKLDNGSVWKKMKGNSIWR